MSLNIDETVIQDFGNEWSKFDQTSLSSYELNLIGEEYFHLFPWDNLPENSEGFDLGCGSGRWAKLVAHKVGHLHCIEPSIAIEIAKKNLVKNLNCSFHRNGVDDIPLNDNSMDFGYSLGVLHHIPNTENGIKSCVRKLKKGAPFLLYLYYSFDNQPIWYKFIWKISDLIRRLISKLPFNLKYILSQFIALFIYLPLSKISKIIELFGFKVHSIPLSAYRFKSFYTMRTDALDRFGTKIEHRYSKLEIKKMMENSGLENIIFSNSIPFWVALGVKK